MVLIPAGMINDLRLEQFLKAEFPIALTPSGISISDTFFVGNDIELDLNMNAASAPKGR